MEIQQTVWKNQRQLKMGYTTGSCAAAASKAAVQMLLTGEEIRQVSLMTPKGTLLYLDIEEITRTPEKVICAVRKDAGDDPDVTHGILVYAEVRRRAEAGISLDGGTGVGRVTRKGLEQAVGEAAINRVPRRMIREAVEEICETYGYSGGISVLISIPEGVELAKKTFNPRLGILGGISVLGTSGIVEPMSEKALTDTIFLEMRMLKENGHDRCYLVPGNYGSDFLREALGYDGELAVKCSNYIGEAIDDAVALEMKGILLIGHIGKLVKLAAGVMNTHSRVADCRMEVLASHAAMAGASGECVRNLMDCITTMEALDFLRECDLLEEVMKTVTGKIDLCLQHRAGEDLQIGAVIFSNEDGILGMTKDAEALIKSIRRDGQEPDAEKAAEKAAENAGKEQKI